ncbi:MAG: GAF domain-containing protein, partial [Bdellovibrionales bacterium]|nr:GAF domain-containing protein [Bdellovibrionales bacterium]
LFNLTKMVSLKVDGVRCSIIHVLDQQKGIVVVSNDDKAATGIQLDLNKYPEVLNVKNTGHLVAIENLEQSRELKPIRKLLREISFNSMIVCPVRRQGDVFGVLSLRMPPEKETVSDNEIRFVEIVGHVVSLLLDQEKSNYSNDFWNDASFEKPIPFPRVKNSKN